MAEHISLRRAKIEEKRAQRQMLITVVVTLIAGLLFLFFVMPLIFRMVISFSRADQNPFALQSNDTLPPQQPVFPPLAEHQKSTELVINGYTEAKAKVYLYVSGQDVREAMADDSGAFQFSLSLSPGEYEIWSEAEDEAGNTSTSTARYMVTVDTTKPSISVETPTEGQVFTLARERTVTVAGKLSEKGIVFVNNSRVATTDDGTFSTRLQLGEGENNLVVKAEDLAGNAADEVNRKVEYRP